MIGRHGIGAHRGVDRRLRTSTLFWFLFTVCGAVGLLVATLLIYFSVRYRAGPAMSVRRQKPSLRENWNGSGRSVPVFPSRSCSSGELRSMLDAFHAPPECDADLRRRQAVDVEIPAPEGQRRINMLHVPVGRPVKLVMTSEDVIHSLFIPAFRVHMDVLPERYTSVWFQATRPGKYHLFCSQYCGTNHAGMMGSVVAMEPAEYQSGLESAEGSLGLEGRKAFLKYRCVSCHSADENGPGRPGGTVRKRSTSNKAKLGRGGRRVHPRVDPRSRREDRRGLGKHHADVPRARSARRKSIALIAYFRSLKRGETPRRVEEFPPPTSRPQINTTAPKRDREVDRAERARRSRHEMPTLLASCIPAGRAAGRGVELPQRLVRRRSWLLTKDHKRIAILYLITVTAMFLWAARPSPSCG